MRDHGHPDFADAKNWTLEMLGMAMPAHLDYSKYLAKKTSPLQPMISQSPEVCALHAAFCEVSGQELPMLPSFERGWLTAHLSGMTPDMVRSVWKKRSQGVRLGERKEASTYLRAFCSENDEVIGWIVQEYAAIMAKARIRVLPKGKAEVLRATGRDASPPGNPVVTSSEVVEKLKEGYSGLRKEVGL